MTATFKEKDIELILSALKFSAEKHRNQRRKDAELRRILTILFRWRNFCGMLEAFVIS